MELETSAGIAKITIKAKEKAGIVTRIMRMTLVREFDALIARALGGDARELLDSLGSQGCTKVEIPIDGIKGEIRLKGEKGDDVTIKSVTGVKAVGKVGKGEDSETTIELVFDFPFALSAWTFLGQNVSGRAELLFTESQLELPKTEKAKTPRKPRVVDMTPLAGGSNGLPEGVTMGADPLTASLADHVEAAEEQRAAATPEEAEALREQRLADEAEGDRRAEIERLEAEQKQDIKATPTLGGGLKNGGLKAPKGAKSKRVKVVDEAGAEIDVDAVAASVQVDAMVAAIMPTAVVSVTGESVIVRAEFQERVGDVVGATMLVEAEGSDRASAEFSMRQKLTGYAAERLAAGAMLVAKVPFADDDSGDGLAF
jgi:hypothetical protein